MRAIFLNSSGLMLSLTLLLSFFPATAIAADIASDDPLSVRGIPFELMLGADAVVREHVQRFEYQRPGRGRMEVRKVITILNRDGRNHGNVNLRYDSFRDVGRIRATIYDADGNRVRRFRNRDIDDYLAFSNVNFVDDARIKSLDMYHTSYPYTIELEYRYDFRGFINLPAFIPQTNVNTTVQHARFEVVLREDQEMEYRVFNLENDEPEINYDGNSRVLIWNAENLAILEREPFGPPVLDLIPRVIIRSSDFSMDGNDGSLRTWNDFGHWIHGLWDGRQSLSDDTKAMVRQIAEENDDPRDTIMELYSYLQRHTRYVSIQLGIGGFQTESAQNTDRYRYGDCKALTNMMMAMLDAAGIKSYPALIESGNSHTEIDPDFPFNTFNHVILMVPIEQDTVWIESTSNHFPPGYIGRGNHNRYTLKFSEDGGELIRTPYLKPEQNFQKRRANIRLSENGSAHAEIETRYGGHQHERMRYFSSLASGPLERELHHMIDLNRFEINSYDIGAELLEPEAWLNLELDLPSYGRVMGNRIFFTPNLLENYGRSVSSIENRRQPVHLNSNYYDEDTLVYHLPEGYRIEALPENIELETEFGYYRTEYTIDEDRNSLIFSRMVRFEEAVLPADEYEVFRSFHNEVVRQDQQQVVLVAN